MNFKDKYTLDKTKEGEDKKIQISPDAYSNAEMLQLLINKLEHMRISNDR